MQMAQLPESIERDGIVLRRLHEDDRAELLAHFADPSVTEHLDIDPLSSESEASEIVAWADDLYARGRGVRWAIRAHETGEFLGTCGFNSIVREHSSRGEIAYDLSRRFWGRGIMNLVVPMLLSVGFDTAGLNRLQALTPRLPARGAAARVRGLARRVLGSGCVCSSSSRVACRLTGGPWRSADRISSESGRTTTTPTPRRSTIHPR
jgi:ribosomal-protein-alanine N-acetyltransferase